MSAGLSIVFFSSACAMDNKRKNKIQDSPQKDSPENNKKIKSSTIQKTDSAYGVDSIIEAAENDDLVKIKNIIDHNFDLNKRYAEGKTLLMFIAEKTQGKHQVLKSLIEAKADPFIQDDKRIMPWKIAYDKQDHACVNILTCDQSLGYQPIEKSLPVEENIGDECSKYTSSYLKINEIILEICIRHFTRGYIVSLQQNDEEVG